MHALRIVLLLIALPPAAVAQRPRVVVLTDIGNEPDDAQSLVRFLVHCDLLDVEALVATTGCWLPDRVNPQLIHERLDAYEAVRPNLAVHADGWPTAERLRQVTVAGRAEYGMGGVGVGKTTDASRRLTAVLDADDPRPVWVLCWGGAVDLAQALWDAREGRTPAEAAALVAQLRVYDIAGQDDCGAWATHAFPELFWIRSKNQWSGISPHVGGQRRETRGGDESVVSAAWTRTHVQSVGPLGALYPDTEYITEGDTPSFLYLLPVGLGDPDRPAWGSWGGRFGSERERNPTWVARLSGAKDRGSQRPYEPFGMFTEAADTVTLGNVTLGNATYTDNPYAPVFRWRPAFQHEFAARMQWSVTPRREDANHPPTVVLNGDAGGDVRTFRTSGPFTLSAAGSTDPDGDPLSYRWLLYPEAGDGRARLTTAAGPVTAVERAAPGSTHVILEVTDEGTPPLTRYRRAVIEFADQ